MTVVVTTNFHLDFRARATAVIYVILVMCSQGAYMQLDSNINTLRYDGEVNIGKMLQ